MRDGHCENTVEVWAGEIVNLPAFLHWAAEMAAQGKDDPILRAIKIKPGVIDQVAQRSRIPSSIPGVEFKRMTL